MITTNFFDFQMDYILFSFGLFCFVLSGVSLLLARLPSEKLPWKWMSLFGLFLGLRHWVEILNPLFSGSVLFEWSRLVVLTIAFSCLAEFVRNGLFKIGGKSVSGLVYLMPVSFILLGGWVEGFRAMEFLIRSLIGMFSSFGTAYVIYQSARFGKESSIERTWLKIAALIFVFFAASLIISPQTNIFPAQWVNEEKFMDVLGFSIFLPRSVLHFIIVFSLWSYLGRRASGGTLKEIERLKYLFFFFLIVFLWIGWKATDELGQYHEKEISGNLMRKVSSVAATLDPGEFADLSGSLKDVESPHYHKILEKLIRIHRVNSDLHYVYLMGLRSGQIFFYADSPMGEEPSNPGEIYEEASPELIASFQKGAPFLEGPYQDRWGVWMSGFAPIRSADGQKVIAVLGMDVAAVQWQKTVFERRLLGILVAALVFILFFGMIIILNMNRMVIGVLEHQYDFLQIMIDAIPIPVYYKDVDGRYLGCNHAFESFVGIPKERIKGKTVYELSPRELADVYFKEDQELFQNGGVQVYQTMVKHADSSLRNVIFSKSVFLNEMGELKGIVGAIQDITEREMNEQQLRKNTEQMSSLLSLNQKESGLAEKEIVQLGLEEAVRLTQSKVGFLHCVNPDQKTLELVAWSKETLKGCTAVYDKHYPLDQAGIWADCAHTKKPFICNDYPNQSGRKGYPQGHSPVTRFISIPVLNVDQVTMIMGVGNKEALYDEHDVRQVQLISETLWKIVQRKRAQQALKENIERLNSITTMAKDAIILTNFGDEVVFWNLAALEMFGYSSGEAVGQKLYSLIHSEVPPQKEFLEAESAKKIAFGGEIFEQMVKDKSGVEFPVEISLSKVKLNDEWHVIRIIRDIRERKRIEVMKDEFIKIVSHELRTPLTGIKESVGIVLDGLAGALNKDQMDILQMGKRSIDRLTHLINDVLELQTFHSGRAKLVMQASDLNRIIMETVRLMMPAAKKKGITFSNQLDQNLPKIVLSPDKIKQVLNVLVGNAIKYTERGSVMIKTEKRGENTVGVSVTDTGVGIPKELLDEMFKSFNQWVPDPYHEPGSTGLGLALSREIIQAHGGKMWVESEFGKGSTFHFLLPMVERRNRS